MHRKYVLLDDHKILSYNIIPNPLSDSDELLNSFQSNHKEKKGPHLKDKVLCQSRLWSIEQIFQFFHSAR